MRKKSRPDASVESIRAASQSGLEGSSRIFLEGSSTGSPINVGTSSTLVHTAPFGLLDETYVWASNYSSADSSVTMSYGGSYSDHNRIVVPVKSQTGLMLVIPGTPLENASLYAKAAEANSINLSGFVLRYYRNKDKAGRVASDGSYDGTSE
jgi:hypothetical protein